MCTASRARSFLQRRRYARTAVFRDAVLALACLAACNSGESGEAAKIDRVQGGRERVGTSFESTSSEAAPPPTLHEMVERGKHWRIATKHGPVHVWIPEGYKRKKAETIVYVHGFYVDVDGAWNGYQLPTQFAGSGINAMFIACEAPSGGHQNVFWPSLGPLLDEVERAIGKKTPRRRIVAIGHSGAWKTLVGWLDEPMLDTVVLLDAVYSEVDAFKAWILGDDKRRLINVSDGTRKLAEQLHADLPDTVVLDSFPTLQQGIPKSAARARILHIKSSLGHFPLVTGGIALPMVLRTLRAKRLVRAPLAEILDRTGSDED
jgi:hypothetical protein